MGKQFMDHVQHMLGIGMGEERTEKHQLPVEKLAKIAIEAGAVEIWIDTHDNKWIDLEFKTFEEGPEMKITEQEEELSIVFKQKNKGRWFNFQLQKAVLIMTVPPQVTEQWNVRATSREISIRNLQTTSLRVQVSSGTIVCETIQAEELLVQASSGRIDMQQIAAKSVQSAVTSGTMKLAQMHSDQLNTSTTSGTTHLHDVVSNRYVSTCTSGKTNVNTVQFEHATITCSSGSITSRDTSTEYIKVSLTSGDFHSVNMQASSAHIEATSGDIWTRLHSSMADYSLEGVATSGDVYVDAPLAFETQKENHVKGVHGSGEKSLYFQVHSGDIHVRSATNHNESKLNQ